MHTHFRVSHAAILIALCATLCTSTGITRAQGVSEVQNAPRTQTIPHAGRDNTASRANHAQSASTTEAISQLCKTKISDNENSCVGLCSSLEESRPASKEGCSRGPTSQLAVLSRRRALVLARSGVYLVVVSFKQKLSNVESISCIEM